MSKLHVCMAVLSAAVWMGGCAAESGEDNHDSQASDQQALDDGAAASAAEAEPGPPPETVQVPPELAADPNTGAAVTPNLNGCGTLVFCADPRFTPHFPSFCTKHNAGCNNDKAFADAIQLCNQVCSPKSICSGAYYVLGPC